MTTRTRKAATSTTPAKKTTARKATTAKTATGRPARKTTAKKTQPRLSLVKPEPAEDRRTVVDLRYPLRPRRRLFVGPMGATEQAAVRAALASAAQRLPIPVRAWNGSTANLTDGTVLIHNPSPDRVFTAHIACRHGAIHGWPITTHDHLRQARAITSACGRKHADNTPGDDGIELDWNKAIAHGIRPTTRLAEGLKTAKKATADTQSMSLNEIGAHIAKQLADTEQPKEHPQP